GVSSAAVDLGGGRADVTLDPSKADRARLKSAVEAAGYSVPERDAPAPQTVTIGPIPTAPRTEGSPETEEWDLAVGGRHCASWVGRVEGALERVPGVKEARVTLATERATVVVDPPRVDESALAAAVESAGYSARRDAPDPAAAAEALRRDRARNVAL